MTARTPQRRKHAERTVRAWVRSTRAFQKNTLGRVPRVRAQRQGQQLSPCWRHEKRIWECRDQGVAKRESEEKEEYDQ